MPSSRHHHLSMKVVCAAYPSRIEHQKPYSSTFSLSFRIDPTGLNHVAAVDSSSQLRVRDLEASHKL